MNHPISFFASKRYSSLVKCSVYCSVAVSLIGTFFKLLNLPGNFLLFDLGILSGSFVGPLLSLLQDSNNQISSASEIRYRKLHNYLLGFSSSLFSVGWIFYMNYWPGGYLILVSGTILSTIAVLLTFYMSYNNKISPNTQKLIAFLLFTFFIWSISNILTKKSGFNYVSVLNNEAEESSKKEILIGDAQIISLKSNITNPNIDKNLEFITQIDKLTEEQIKYFDALKLEILYRNNEEVNMTNPNSNSIIQTPKDKNSTLYPIKMNLNFIFVKGAYDEVMRIFGITQNLQKPEIYQCKTSNATAGIEMWNKMLKYRSDLCSLIVESSSSDVLRYQFIDPKINKFRSQEEMIAKIQKGLKKGKINDSDYSAVMEIYIQLTKNEYFETDFSTDKVHWLSQTFYHTPTIVAIYELSKLQNEVLTARKIALHCIANR